MERRNHARVAVNLKAALLDDQAMPVGCRVRDVSKGGMLLQHERHDIASNFQEGDSVEVRLSIRQDDERKVFPLSMTVKHVEENGIGVEFLQPQSQLMTLVEPYRLDREDARQIVAQAEQEKNATVNTATPAPATTTTRASRRRFAIQRARAQFAESMQTPREPAAAKEASAALQPPGDSTATGKGDRRLFYVGLLSLIAAVGLLLFNFGHRSELENRMSALESVIDRQVNALTMLRARLGPADTRAHELSSLNARVDMLSASFAALETRITQAAEQARATAPGPATASPAAMPGADQQAVSHQPSVETASITPPPAQAAGADARWVINLVSLYDKAAAKRFAQKAQAQGIPADTRQVSVKQKQVWRVQVGGFQSREEASTYADAHREKLGLNSVWIFRK